MLRFESQRWAGRGYVRAVERALSGLVPSRSPEVPGMNMVFPVADPVTPLAAAPAILAAANHLLPHLERGQRIDAAT